MITAGNDQDHAIQQDVLATAQLGVKPGAHVQQRRDSPAGLDLAAGGASDAREQPQRGGFASPIPTHQPERLTPLETQRQVAHGPDLAARIATAEQIEGHPARATTLAQQVALPDPVQLDQRLR